MGLDVGVVRIQYLDRPHGAGYEFLWQLAIDADKADWEVSSEANSFIELSRENMLSQADWFVSENGLDDDNSRLIRDWVNSLPWVSDMIMLHLGW